MKDVFLTALLGLPIALPLGAAAYGLLCVQLKRSGRPLRAACVLVLVVLGAGILYGFLRFSGIILFPEDNSWSVNWLDDSWRDDGFRYIYGCSTLAAAVLAALRVEKKNLMMKE